MDSSTSFWVQNCRPGDRGMFITVVILGVLIGTILFAYTAFAPTNDHRSIKQIAIIFRHGARNPTEFYKKDPHVKEDWEGGPGALTIEGMRQEYKLGQWIRNEYDSVIGRKYHPKYFSVLSSYADRCIMSAQALLAALFRPQSDEKLIVDDLPWRPIPVHPIPREQDRLIVLKHPCPNLERALQEAYANHSKIHGKHMAPYYRDLSYHTGQNISTITDVEFLYSTLEIEENRGLTLPDWTNKFYNQEMRDIAASSLAIFTSNQIQRRLRGGPLLKQITDDMMRARNGQDETKLYLYSAHDITLVNVLRAMGFTEELFKPDFAAALIFELVLSEDVEEHDLELDVKVKYLNNTEVHEAVDLKIPGCKEKCKFKDLLVVWQDILPVNWNSECLS